MEAYDFLHEWVKPIIKGDYQDFSSKKVEGYSLFVSEYKKHSPQGNRFKNARGITIDFRKRASITFRSKRSPEGHLKRKSTCEKFVSA